MRLTLKIVGLVLALLFIAILALPLYFDANQFRPLLQTTLSDLMGRDVTIGSLRLSLFSQSITGSSVEVAEDPAFGGVPFLRSASLEAGVELWPLVASRKFILTRLSFDHPEVEAIQNASGAWNFSSIGSKPDDAESKLDAAPPDTSSQPKSAPFGIPLIEATEGRITFRNTGNSQPPVVLDRMNFEVRDFTAASAFVFRFEGILSGGGTIRLAGKAGPINWGNAIATPVDANLHVTHLDLGVSGVLDPTLGLAGITSVDGNVLAYDASAIVTGRLRGERLRLVKTGQPAQRPLEVDFAVEHDLNRQSGTIYRGDIHLGSAVASLTGTYKSSGDTTVLNLDLAGHNLDVTELGAFLPAIDIVLPEGASIENGTADVHFTAQGPADRLVAIGSFGLDGVQLTNFDLVTKLSVLDQMAGVKPGKHTEVQSFHAAMRSAPDGTEVRDIDMEVPSIGNLSGAGKVSPSHNLAFKMRAAIHHGVGAVAGFGSGGVPFTVSGTSQRPSFKADVKDFVDDKAKGLGGVFHRKKKADKPGEPETDDADSDATPAEPER